MEQVPLGEAVLLEVVGHPAGEPGELGRGRGELAPGRLTVRALAQQRGHGGVQVAHHRPPDVPAPVPVVQLAERARYLADRGHVGDPDPARARGGDPLAGRLGEPPDDPGRTGADHEGGVEQEPASLDVGLPQCGHACHTLLPRRGELLSEVERDGSTRWAGVRSGHPRPEPREGDRHRPGRLRLTRSWDPVRHGAGPGSPRRDLREPTGRAEDAQQAGQALPGPPGLGEAPRTRQLGGTSHRSSPGQAQPSVTESSLYSTERDYLKGFPCTTACRSTERNEP